MFTAIAIAITALYSDISHNATNGPVYELAPTTIVVEAPETPVRTFEVCLHDGQGNERACRVARVSDVTQALSLGRAFFGPTGIVTAEVGK